MTAATNSLTKERRGRDCAKSAARLNPACCSQARTAQLWLSDGASERAGCRTRRKAAGRESDDCCDQLTYKGETRPRLCQVGRQTKPSVLQPGTHSPTMAERRSERESRLQNASEGCRQRE